MNQSKIDDDRLLEMFDDDATIEAMMNEFRCSRTALWEARARLGIEKRFKPGVVPVDDERVDLLFRRGWTIKEIAEELDCCRGTIERARRRINRAKTADETDPDLYGRKA